MALPTPDPPTLRSVARRVVERALAQARVAIPAKVVSFDRRRRTVEAQPLIRRPGRDGGTTQEPALADVPVVWPGTGRHRVRFPLRAGDTVLLVFLDRASDDWALGLQLPTATNPPLVDPAEVRSHDYADAVAIPLSTFSAALSAEVASGLAPMEDRLVVENESAQLALIDGGFVALGRRTPGGGPSVEVLDLFDQTLAALGASIVIDAPTKVLLAAIKVLLLTIKGSL